MRIIAGEWQYVDDLWRPPAGYAVGIDLRLEGEQGPPSVGQKNIGLFVGPTGASVPGGYTDLGSQHPRNIRMGQARRQALQSMMGISKTPQGDDLWDVLRWIFSAGADHTGQDGKRPLEALDRPWEIRIGTGQARVNLEWRRFSIKLQAARPLLRQLKVKLKAWRDNALAGKFLQPIISNGKVVGVQVDSNYHRRLANKLLKKIRRYGLRLEDIRPSEWPASETLLPESTTVTDDFNRGDSDTMGMSSEGWSWFEYDLLGSTNLRIIENQVGCSSSTAGHGRADVDLSSDDHEAFVVLTSTISASAQMSVMTRMLVNSNPTYYVFNGTGAGGDSNIIKYTGDYLSGTMLGSSAVTPSQNDIIKGHSSGSTHSLRFNDVVQVEVTDSDITGNVRCGVGCARTNIRGDNWQANDLEVAESDHKPPNKMSLSCGCIGM